MVSPVVQKIGGLLTPIAAQECEQTAISTSTSTFQLFSPVRPPRSSHALNSFGIRRRDPYIHLDEQRRSHIRHRRRSTLKVLSKGGSQDRAGPAACDGGMKAVLLAISLISPLDHPCCLNCRSTSCRRSCFNLFHLQTRCSPLLGTHQHSRTTGTSPSHISARHRFSAREASGVLLPARSEEGANREATKRCPRRARSRPWSQNGRSSTLVDRVFQETILRRFGSSKVLMLLVALASEDSYLAYRSAPAEVGHLKWMLDTTKGASPELHRPPRCRQDACLEWLTKDDGRYQRLQLRASSSTACLTRGKVVFAASVDLAPSPCPLCF